MRGGEHVVRARIADADQCGCGCGRVTAIAGHTGRTLRRRGTTLRR